MSRLKDLYNKKVKSDLKEKLGHGNINMVPKLTKIVVNCVTKDCVTNSKIVGNIACLLYTSPSPRDGLLSRMPSSA